jgi:hypothetical protein
VIRSINTGEPLILDGEASPFAKDLKALGAEMTGLGAVTNGKRAGCSAAAGSSAAAKETAHE